MRIAVKPLQNTASAVSAFRATIPMTYVGELGHEVRLLAGKKGEHDELREIIRTWDVIHLLSPAKRYEDAEPEIKERKGALVIDLDDDIWSWNEDLARVIADKSSMNRDAKGMLAMNEGRALDLATWLEAADLVTTTTDYLAERIQHHAPRAQVRVIDNAVTPEMARVKPRGARHPLAVQPSMRKGENRNKPCDCGSGKKWKMCHGAPGVNGAGAPVLGARTVAWTGSVAHLPDLPPVLNALARVRSVDGTLQVRSLGPVDFMDTPGFKAVFSGSGDYAPVTVRDSQGRSHLQVPFARYYDALEGMEADLAVIPMRDSAFNRGKSAITLYSWAIQEVPCVVARAGPYLVSERESFPAVYVEPGDVEMWTTEIRDLLYDDEKRKELGAAAKAFVLEHHSFPDKAHEWAGAWARALGRVASREMTA